MSRKKKHSNNGHWNSNTKKTETPGGDEALQHAAQELTEAMRLLAEPLQTFLIHLLVKQTRSDISIRDLTRALIISRSGEGFEPAVQHAIRSYRNAYEEICRVEDNKELSRACREDIIAGFRRLLVKNAEDLEFLGIEIVNVEPDQALDLGIHQVVKRFAADNKRQVGTVKRCVTPGFRWTSVNWRERVEPAEVWAYTECREEPKPPSASLPLDRDILGDHFNLS